MLKIDPSALAAIVAHARKVAPQRACGLLIGRGGLARREALVAEEAATLAADRARGRFDLHPGDWQRIDRGARARSLDVVGVYCAVAGARTELEAKDAATVTEGYSYLVVDPSAAPPRLFAFELTILGTDSEPVEVGTIEQVQARPPPLMRPMPQVDDKNMGGHQLH